MLQWETLDSRAKIVLLVDDEPPVREYVRRILTKDGFAVMEAADGIEGYDLVRKLGCQMALLVTDIKMPRMDGISLAESVRQLCPTVPVLLISGCAFPFNREAGEYALLRKPFLPADLRHAVRNLTAA